MWRRRELLCVVVACVGWCSCAGGQEVVPHPGAGDAGPGGATVGNGGAGGMSAAGGAGGSAGDGMTDGGAAPADHPTDPDAGMPDAGAAAPDLVVRPAVFPDGLTLLAGQPGGEGVADGVGTAARMRNPSSVVADGMGTLYFTDDLSHVIRKLDLATG